MASSNGNTPLDFNEVSVLMILGEVNGFTVKALHSTGAQGCYMTIDCVERCQLTNILDTRSPRNVIFLSERIPLLGTVNVPINLEVKLPDGCMKTVSYPTLFHVTRRDLTDVVLGVEFPVQILDPTNGKLVIGGGEIPFLRRGEWAEPIRSTRQFLALRILERHPPRKNP